MKYLGLILATFVFCINTTLFAGNILNDIATAIGSNDVEKISTYINSNVDITIDDNDDTYSKEQAKAILSEYLDSNPIKSIKLLHNGASGSNTQYAIASASTKNGTYRVYMLIAKESESFQLVELRFEEE